MKGGNLDDGSERREDGAARGADRKPMAAALAGSAIIKKRGVGRPPGSTSTRPTREVIKQIRFTVKEWQAIESAAESKKKTVADWQREELAKAAERVLK